MIYKTKLTIFFSSSSNFRRSRSISRPAFLRVRSLSRCCSKMNTRIRCRKREVFVSLNACDEERWLIIHQQYNIECSKSFVSTYPWALVSSQIYHLKNPFDFFSAKLSCWYAKIGSKMIEMIFYCLNCVLEDVRQTKYLWCYSLDFVLVLKRQKCQMIIRHGILHFASSASTANICAQTEKKWIFSAKSQQIEFISNQRQSNWRVKNGWN